MSREMGWQYRDMAHALIRTVLTRLMVRLDTAPVFPGQVYVLTMQVTAGAAASTVSAVFLAAFAIPVTFESVMWVSGSGSLANVASFTPGAIGVTQATNALALKTCCEVPHDVAVAYSTAQQLIVTAWDQLVAIVLVALVFGWSGGKQLVTQSYADAKQKTEQAKTSRAAKRRRRRGNR